MLSRTQVRRSHAGQRIHDECPRLTSGRWIEGAASETSRRGVTVLVRSQDEHSTVTAPRAGGWSATL
ncbi:MAG: hypothetical protein QOI54_996 [Actinomycetota bacterium]|jgi:hypothetical protein|nr:hypothetical protein [Actinomycetota bacterium]